MEVKLSANGQTVDLSTPAKRKEWAEYFDKVGMVRPTIIIPGFGTIYADQVRFEMSNSNGAESNEIERLREIEQRAKLVIAEWPRAGYIGEPMADQLEYLRDLLTD